MFPKSAPPFKTIIYYRSNVVKFVFASGGSNEKRAFDAARVHSKPVACGDFAWDLARKLSWVSALRGLAASRRSPDTRELVYEQLQLDTNGTLASLSAWLGVDAPTRRRLGFKRGSEDLRLTVSNFDEVESWLAPGGRPCETSRPTPVEETQHRRPPRLALPLTHAPERDARGLRGVPRAGRARGLRLAAPAAAQGQELHRV